jgi:dTDP-4-dehydrorhamnose reductase
MTGWLVLGAGGQLGLSLQEVLTNASIPHVALGSKECDITDPASVAAALNLASPEVVVNCAAWTAVDAAEDHEDDAFLVNCSGPANLASACRASGARFVHISTDYVFAGDQVGPYGEDAPTGPVSVYGRSKLCGEREVMSAHPHGAYVVRTAWLYSKYGSNFAKTMLRRARIGAAVRVVNDQTGQPTLADDLARHLRDIVTSTAPAGIYHGTNAGACTWFDFARELYSLAGADVSLVSPVPSSEYPTRAVRPSNSVLGHARTIAAGVPEMRPWEGAAADSVTTIVEELSKEELP